MTEDDIRNHVQKFKQLNGGEPNGEVNPFLEKFQKQSNTQKPIDNIELPKPDLSKYNDLITSSIKMEDADIAEAQTVELTTAGGNYYPDPKGGFYNVKTATLLPITSFEEDILTNADLMESGEWYKILFKRLVKGLPFETSKLMRGDIDLFIIKFRADSFGTKYNVSILNPFTGNQEEHPVDLTKVKIKEVKKLPDEEGLFTYKFEQFDKTVKYRLLNREEELQLEKEIDEHQKMENLPWRPTTFHTLSKHIVSVDGDTNTAEIRKFVRSLKPKDSRPLAIDIRNNTPGIDKLYTFVDKASGKKFPGILQPDFDFFLITE